MSSLISKVNDLLANLDGAFWVAIGLAIAIGLLRSLSWLVHWFRFRTGIPLVFQSLSAIDEQQAKDAKLFAGDDLVPKLMAYIAEDPPGTLVPGGLGTSGPVAAAAEAGDRSDWTTMLVALAWSPRPSYHVQLSVVDAEPASDATVQVLTVAGMRGEPPGNRKTKVTVSIFRQPGGRMVAATTIEKPWKDLDSHIGAFCIFHVGNQPAVRRRTPRWEQWHSPEAYRLYRKGLLSRRIALDSQLQYIKWASRIEEMRLGLLDGDVDEYRSRCDRAHAKYAQHLAKAAELFSLAGRMDPANILPPLARAAILELSGSDEALALYTACREQWQEQVEISYRIAAQGPPSSGDLLAAGAVITWLRAALLDTTRLLDRGPLVRMWLRTWLPGHWAPGERRYWSGWFKPEHPRAPRISLRSKRREYRTATSVVLIATAMAMLTKILADVELDPDGANTKDRDVARDLFAQLDKMLNDGRKPISTTLRRLFHPNPRLRRAVTEAALPERHTHPVKGAQGAVQLISTQHDVWVRPAKRIGWLAHFNAACCYSLAIELPEGARPWICDDPTWQEDCCRAALRELTKVLRHPYSQLDTSWLWYDPDLDPLKAALLLRSEVRKADPLVQLARRIGLPLVTPLRP